MGNDRHRDGRRDDEADREPADRAGHGAQVAERREERRAVEERRQHAEEDELRLELELRHPGHEAEQEAAEDEQDRVRDTDRGRDDEQPRDGDEERERDEPVRGVEMHRPILPSPGPPTARCPRYRGESGDGGQLATEHAVRTAGEAARTRRGATARRAPPASGGCAGRGTAPPGRARRGSRAQREARRDAPQRRHRARRRSSDG